MKTISQDKDIPMNPKCGNCKKEITTIGRYVWRDGGYLYVHRQYNEKTHKCNLTGDI